jgi:hypothetical protein
MTKTETIVIWNKYICPIKSISEKEKQDIFDDMLKKADDELKSENLPEGITSGVALSMLQNEKPTRVVIKNVKFKKMYASNCPDEIEGDLYFEVEKK